MNFIEKLMCYPSFSLLHFLITITLIQFWWIAIWGLAYIGISAIAGKSKSKEILLYIGILLSTLLIFQIEPTLLEKL